MYGHSLPVSRQDGSKRKRPAVDDLPEPLPGAHIGDAPAVCRREQRHPEAQTGEDPRHLFAPDFVRDDRFRRERTRGDFQSRPGGTVGENGEKPPYAPERDLPARVHRDDPAHSRQPVGQFPQERGLARARSPDEQDPPAG